MTALSERMKGKICAYCANNKGGCAADVPYYCVSVRCGHFAEEAAPAAKKKRGASMRAIMRRSLVETF